jgi:hypothetical protein
MSLREGEPERERKKDREKKKSVGDYISKPLWPK